MRTTDGGPLGFPTPLLLDTHIWVLHVEGDTAAISPSVQAAIDLATRENRAWVSAISVWEIAMLEQRGTLTLSADLRAWVAASRIAPGIRIAPLSPLILMDGPRLPVWNKKKTKLPHKDPADRWIVATARQRNAIVITRDTEILNYADQGHVRAFDARS